MRLEVVPTHDRISSFPDHRLASNHMHSCTGSTLFPTFISSPTESSPSYSASIFRPSSSSLVGCHSICLLLRLLIFLRVILVMTGMGVVLPLGTTGQVYRTSRSSRRTTQKAYGIRAENVYRLRVGPSCCPRRRRRLLVYVISCVSCAQFL